MNKTTGVALIGMACAVLVACDDKSSSAPGASSASAAASGSAKGEDLAGGTKHDPPIKVDAVAAGQWYCDMGTVHYSRPAEGDGKCALCGMKLKHKE